MGIKLRCPLDFGTTCIVNQITWYRAHTEDGVRSVAVSEVTFDPLLFYIQAVFKEEEGWYWCVATNSLLDDNRDIEMVETGAYLEVTARPEQPVDEQPPQRQPDGWCHELLTGRGSHNKSYRFTTSGS